MAVSDLTQHELFDAIVQEILGSISGIHLSNVILDPKSTPNTRQHKVFSIDMQTVNTQKYRDHKDRRVRMESSTTIRILHRMNPKDQTLTQKTALNDEQNVIAALMTTTRAPLNYTRVSYRATRRAIHGSQEWLMTDVTFSIEYDFELAPVLA